MKKSWLQRFSCDNFFLLLAGEFEAAVEDGFAGTGGWKEKERGEEPEAKGGLARNFGGRDSERDADEGISPQEDQGAGV